MTWQPTVEIGIEGIISGLVQFRRIAIANCIVYPMSKPRPSQENLGEFLLHRLGVGLEAYIPDVLNLLDCLRLGEKGYRHFPFPEDLRDMLMISRPLLIEDP